MAAIREVHKTSPKIGEEQFVKRPARKAGNHFRVSQNIVEDLIDFLLEFPIPEKVI